MTLQDIISAAQELVGEWLPFIAAAGVVGLGGFFLRRLIRALR